MVMTSSEPSLHRNYPISLVLCHYPTSFNYLTALTLLSLVRHYSSYFTGRDLKDIPSCRNISMCNVPRSPTPGSCHSLAFIENHNVAFYAPERIDLPIFTNFGALFLRSEEHTSELQ